MLTLNSDRPVLVTGAAGKTGQAVTAALARRGIAVRAFVRTPEQMDALRAIGAADGFAGDLQNPADLASAFHGSGAVYHIPPNVHPQEVEIGAAVIRAAETAGVERLVFHSVLHPQTERMPHHWKKLRVEERLFESGLAYTVLQPAVYMQNFTAGWQTMAQNGMHTVPYPAGTRLSLVDLEDVAEAAAVVIAEEKYAYGIYELAGTPPLSQQEVASAAGRALGRPVAVAEISVDAWKREMVRRGEMTGYAIETLGAMFDYYARYGLKGSPWALREILGREPRGLQHFFDRLARGRPAG